MEHLPFTIQLEMDQMKHTIIHHFNTHQRELSERLEIEINNAIQCFDFSKAVLEATHKTLNDVISSYFQYGEGRKMIKDSMEESLKATFGKEAVDNSD